MVLTLLLNADYMPVHVVSWQRAVTLYYSGKVEVLREHDGVEVRAVRFTMKAPSVVRLLRYARIKRLEHVPFTRAHVYARDAWTCGYCGARKPEADLTYDHVVPASRGGIKSWENVITACVSCNRRKDDRTPDEAGMPLLWKPRKPSRLAILTVTVGLKKAPTGWADFLIGHAALRTT